MQEEHDQYAAHGIQPILISLNSASSAHQWSIDVSCPFLHLADINGNIYAALGVGRSYKGTWNAAVLASYTTYLLQGNSLPSSPLSLSPPDLEQLGADIIMEVRTGNIRMVYYGRGSLDRPSLDKRLACITT